MPIIYFSSLDALINASGHLSHHNMNYQSTQAAPMSSEDAALVLNALAMGTSNIAEGTQHAGGCMMDATKLGHNEVIIATENSDVPKKGEREKERGTYKSFSERIEDLKAFKARHGHLNVSSTQDKSLAQFCSITRHARKHKGKSVMRLSDDRIAKLDAIGFIWSIRDRKPKQQPKEESTTQPMLEESSQNMIKFLQQAAAETSEHEPMIQFEPPQHGPSYPLRSPDYSNQSIESLSEKILAKVEEMEEQKEPPSLMSPDYSNQSIESLCEKILAKVEEMGEQKEPSLRGKVLSFSTGANVNETSHS